MNKKLSAALLCTAALILRACGGESKQTASTVEAETPEVKTARVSKQLVPQTQEYTATVESDVKNNIAPNTPYRIERIYADVGDHVRKGQVLVQLDASNLKQVRLQVDNQKIELGRVEALYKVGGASKAEYDNAQMQYNILNTQYRQLVQNTQLVAPISGVVTARNYDDGDMYAQQPILTIEQTNPVKLLINVSENFYKKVSVGMNTDILVDAYEDETFQGKVTTVYPTIDAATHTFPVEITINNANQKVRPGMFARATINFGDVEHVVVPDAAVVKQIGSGDHYVYIHKKGTVSYSKVELGQHIGDTYEIISGVNNGDEVVVAGQVRLTNGAKVKVIK
jgi:RND family efflux transporter MFP subunit